MRGHLHEYRITVIDPVSGARGRLYVLSRFAQSISVVDVSSHPGNEIAVVPLPFDAEPPSLRAAAALAPGAAQTCRSAVYCADDADADGIGDACDLEP